jgi:hypothetical protein
VRSDTSTSAMDPDVSPLSKCRKMANFSTCLLPGIDQRFRREFGAFREKIVDGYM